MSRTPHRVASTFAGARVLITGHTGFEGSWLAVWLHSLGAEITGYALPPEHEHDHFNSLSLPKKIGHVEGDIRDFDRLKAVVVKAQPEFVFHLAAQPLAQKSYAKPRETFETNVMGSINLLEALRTCESAPVLIYVTSDNCYLDQHWTWGYRETDSLGGDDPYSASKACAELALTAFHQSYFRGSRIRCGSVRAGNVIGGGDWSEDRIIPQCVRGIREDRPVEVPNPREVRPWQHVLEPISGYLTLAAGLASGEVPTGQAWNFGPAPESQRNVAELVETFLASWGSGSAAFGSNAQDENRNRALYLNCDKSRHELGWHSRWNFQRSVQATVDWYRCWLQGVNAWTLTSDQIRTYSEAFHDR